MQTEGRFVGMSSIADPKTAFEPIFAEPTEERKKRWYLWNLAVVSGKKGSYQGLPDSVVTKATKNLDEEDQITDFSARDGAINKIARRRNKNKVAKNSRRENRG